MTHPHEDVVIVACAMTGCPELIAPDPRHLDNITARGGWLCHRHDSTERTTNR